MRVTKEMVDFAKKNHSRDYISELEDVLDKEINKAKYKREAREKKIKRIFRDEV